MNNFDKIEELQAQYFKYGFVYLNTSESIDIIEKLEKINDSYVVLTLIGSFEYKTVEEIVIKFFKKIVYLAINGNLTQIVLSRKIIKGIDIDYLKENLISIITDILSTSNIEIGYEDYMYLNIVQLLVELNLIEEVLCFLENYCKQNENEEIRQIYLDYFED